MKLLILAIVLFSYSTLVLAQAPPPLVDQQTDGLFANQGQLILAVLYLVGTIINHLLADRREKRQREWLIEDRRATAELTLKTAKEVHDDSIEINRKIDKIASVTKVRKGDLDPKRHDDNQGGDREF